MFDPLQVHILYTCSFDSRMSIADRLYQLFHPHIVSRLKTRVSQPLTPSTFRPQYEEIHLDRIRKCSLGDSRNSIYNQHKNSQQSLLLKLIAFIISQQFLYAIYSNNSCLDCSPCRNCSVVVETLMLTEICGIAYGHIRFEVLQLSRKL